MAKSLKDRFNGNAQEVIKDTKTYGWDYAMRKQGVKDCIVFDNWYKDETGRSVFKTKPLYPVSSGEDMGKQLIEGFANYVLGMEAVGKQREERIKFLEYQLRNREAQNYDQARGLIRVFNEA